MMEVICDECGKKYRVDETKMKGDRAKARCKNCNHVMAVTRLPADAASVPSQSAADYQPAETTAAPEQIVSRPQTVPRSVVERPRPRA